MKKSISSKLKKALIVMLAFITMFIAMPIRSEANIINDFVNLLLYIPDGIMTIIDGKIGESKEFTSRELDFKGWDKNGHIYNFKVTPYEIFTSGCYEDKGDGNYTVKLGYLDVNFFSDRPIVSEAGGVVSSNILAPVIGNIYKALRNFCMVLMLLVILYIGIKILISSIAEQQAKYKQFLMDWVVGFALLFMMHYIMAGIVGLNTLVIQMLSNDEGDSYYVGVNELENVNGDGNANWSTWLDIVQGKASLDDVVKIGDTSFNHKWEKEEEFLSNRVITIDEDNYAATYSNAEYIKGLNAKYGTSAVGVEQNGRLDLNDFYMVNVVYNKNAPLGYRPILKGKSKTHSWGDDGVIYLSASIVNPEPFNEFKELEYKDRAIIKFNAMSYARTISNFSSDNDAVILYQNNGIKEVDTLDSMGYSALYLCLVIETIMFLFVYIKRVLQMAFLTMVAPIVAIMYPVDKLGDGKAQAFNQWFKDYLFNILIQPMHLLLYTVFIVAAGQLISRNIIYGVAVYAFMIPAENYFKKILGFEKASNSGGGALSKAIGGGLAMEGLGRLAGIGPAARGKGSGGSGDGKSRIRKIGKNTPGSAPASDGIGDGPGASGGGNGGTGGNGGAGGRNSQGRQNRRNGGANGPGAGGGAPGAGGREKFGKLLSRSGNIVKRRIAKAVTGGDYGNLKSPEARRAAFSTGIKTAAKWGGSKISRAVGAGMGAGAGLVVGAATAMATGDFSNVTKGTLLGATGGSKYLGNKFDSAAGFIDDFGNDMRAEIANEKELVAQVDDAGNPILDDNGDQVYEYEYTDDAEKMRKQLRNEQTLKKLDDELNDLPESERDEYIDLIDRYAQYVNIDDIKDVKALKEINKLTDENGNALSAKEAADIYDDAHGYDVRTHRDAYMKSQMLDYVDGFVDPITHNPLSQADKEKIINDIIKDPTKIEELQTMGPATADQTKAWHDQWQAFYDKAIRRANNVMKAQKKIK